LLLRLGILATWQRCSVDIPGTGNVESMRGDEGWTALFRSWRYTRWMAPATYTSGGPSTYLPDRDGWYESSAGKVWERRTSRQGIDRCGKMVRSRPQESVSTRSRQTVLAAPPTLAVDRDDLPQQPGSGWMLYDRGRSVMGEETKGTEVPAWQVDVDVVGDVPGRELVCCARANNSKNPQEGP